jgi:hypothetical protein
MSQDLVTVFKVLVSGEPHIFDDIDSAVAYLRAQALNSQALSNSPLVIESSKISIEQYRLEVEKQDGGQ